MLSKLSLRATFTVVMGVLLSGFLTFGYVAYSKLNLLAVEGPIYKGLVQGKDLIADVLPPPAYVIESHLLVYRLSDSPISQRPELLKQLEQRKQEFLARSNYWHQQDISSQLKQLIEKELTPSGKEFYDGIDKHFLPALNSNDHEKIRNSLAQMDDLYEKHRKIVDNIVAQAIQENSAFSDSATDEISTAYSWLFIILILSIGVSLIVAFAASQVIYHQLGGEPQYVNDVVSELAEGNLRLTIESSRYGHSVLKGIQGMVSRFVDVTRSVDKINRDVSQSIFHVANTTREISSSISTQQTISEEVTQASDSLKQILYSVQDMTKNAREKTQSVESKARAGLESIAHINQAMEKAVNRVDLSEHSVRELANASSEINSIVSSIKTIADQTNLLALNAAIEAARAGEQGRGFAVVADEVRTLATKTADATAMIQSIVNDLNNKVDESLNSMTQVANVVKETQQQVQQNGESIQKIAREAHDSSEYSGEIASASSLQIEKISDLDTRLQNLFETMKSSTSTLDLVHSISDALHKTVSTLQDKIAFFKFDQQEKPKQLHPNDKRKFERIKNSLFINIRMGNDKISALAKDFSMGGLLLSLPDSLNSKMNDLLLLEIKPPHKDMDQYLKQKTLTVSGKIVRIEHQGDEHLYGIEFMNLSRDAINILSEALAFYESEKPPK